MKKIAVFLGSLLLTLAVSAATVNNARTGNAGGASTSASNTWTQQQAFSANGAASTPAVYMTGTIFTGGSTTTTMPLFLVQPSTAAASTGWATTGTVIGVEAQSGFGGNLIDVQVNGSSQFAVSAVGVAQTSQINLFNSMNIGGQIKNYSDSGNATIDPNVNGTAITRNQADANPALSVTQLNASSTGDVLDVSNSATLLFSISKAGHVTTKMTTAPAVTTGAADCGTSPAIAGNDNNGRVTVGSSTNGGKCTLTFNTAWATAPNCVCSNETTANTCRAASTSTTTVALTGTLTAADKISYICIGFR